MNQSLGMVSLIVREYDEALRFFVDTLGFRLIEDTRVPEQDKRWVVVKPDGPGGACDYDLYKLKGVKFIREPDQQPHGLVAVFEDLYGNAWDLIQPSERNRSWQP